MKKVALIALFPLAACGSDTPVPDYPFPASPPLEETDLAVFLDSGGEEPVDEDLDEAWDDGLDDEVAAEAPAAEAPAAEAPATEAPATSSARRRTR